jgi:hypothetical protein
MDRGFICACHSAISMGHYQYAIDAKKIGSKNKGSQDVIGNTCTSISKNFRIASLHANNCKWAYP